MAFTKKIFEKIKGNQFWKSVATLSSGQIVSLLINTISIFVISRIYNQEAFGDFAIITSTATIIIGFIGLGLGSAIMVPKNDEESRKVFNVAFYIQLFLAFLLSIGLIIIKPFYEFFSSQIPYDIAIIFMFFYIVLSVLSSLLNVYINRLGMDRVLFLNSLIGAIVTVVVKIPLGFMGSGTYGLLIATNISLIIINIHMIRKANPFHKVPSVSLCLSVLKEYKNFIIYQYPSNLMGTFTNQMPNQLLSSHYGNTALGNYSMCNSILGTPTALIATPIQTVYFRSVSQRYRDGENIADFTYSLVSKIMIIAFIPVLVLMIFGDKLFLFLLGDKWATAGVIASILALQYVFSFCYNCITYCRVAIQKQRINLFTAFFQFAIIIISLIIGIYYYRSFIITIYCFAFANLIYNIINISITFYCLKKYAVRFFIFSTIYCLASLFFAYLIKKIFSV